MPEELRFAETLSVEEAKKQFERLLKWLKSDAPDDCVPPVGHIELTEVEDS